MKATHQVARKLAPRDLWPRDLWRGLAAAALLGLCAVATEACTLTVDDLVPERITEANAASGTGGSATEPSACPGGEGCCSADAECAAGESCVGGRCLGVSCMQLGDGSACAQPPPACSGPECEPPPVMLAPTCTDSLQNGTEAGVDCGPGCPNLCSAGGSCSENSDCTSGNCSAGRCIGARCDDEIRNQDETDVDCGGSCGDVCAPNRGCLSSDDCASPLFCSPTTSRCTDPTCDDEVLNGDEILLDCGGGTCPGCPNGTRCEEGQDCLSGSCGNNGLCAAPSCNDDVRNQNELGPDCGGVCPGCRTGTPCIVLSDCASGVCGPGNCAPGVASCCQAPSCTDTRRNGTETGVDCGGLCPRCPDLSPCNRGQDCVNQNCFNGQCISCGDTVINGTETDRDCGGADPFCQRCAPGLACRVDADCAGPISACEGGRCCGGNLGNCTRCAERLSPTQNCSNAAASGGEGNCTAFLQCLARNPGVCAARFAPGCSALPTEVCNHNDYGGNGGVALQQASAVLSEAGCQQ